MERHDLTTLFVREATAAGATVRHAATPADARREILEILGEHGARHVIRGATSALEKLHLDDALEGAGLEVTVARLDDETTGETTPEALRATAFAADVGLTTADLAVAETGTLALLARPGQGRAVSLLPPVHIALLAADDIVLELGELFERVSARGDLPSALTFITGPSKTGDIELILTVGVHGPAALHVVVVG